MRRKDGKPKRPANRTKPEYEYGFRTNPQTATYRHPCCDQELPPNNWSVVSLFSGCGGLDLSFMGGFNYLGKFYCVLPFSIVEAIDNLADAVECYRLNISDHCREEDLTTIPISSLRRADILTGGFPCQDFSSSGSKKGFDGRRGHLYKVLVEYMHNYQPKVVVAENVPYLARLGNGKYLQTIIQDFEGEGYHFDTWELYGPDYGLSQSRRRIFLVGVRNDLPGFPVKPPPTHINAHLPTKHAIEDLEAIDDETVTNQSQFFVASRASSGGGQGDHTNEAEKVAYCIRANARGRIQFHYSLNRRLTVRECARLQSFPDEFIFPFTTQRNLTLIGNAVPPILGHCVANAVAAYLSAVESTPRCTGSGAVKGDVPGVQMHRSRALQLELF